MDKKRKQYIENCEVSYIETATLGGYEQKFAVEGKSAKLPVLLCLHGGPGSPVPFSVGCRGLFQEITDRFLAVYWDQLGCGINNRKIDDGFSIRDFADMTVDLIKFVKSRFPANKLYLFGMSWGSLLAAHAALELPGSIDGVVTYGQILTTPMLSDDAFDTVESSSAPEKQKAFARALRTQKAEDMSVRDLMRFSKIIRKYTNGYTVLGEKSAPLFDVLNGLRTSPDYRLKDLIAVFKNGYAKNKSLMFELAKTDIRGELKSVSVPYMMFQGERDIVTSTKNAVAFADGSLNPKIACTVMPNTGHFPSLAAMNDIFDYLYKTST